MEQEARMNRWAMAWLGAALAVAAAMPARAIARAEAAALPDAPMPTLILSVPWQPMLQFGGGPGSVSSGASAQGRSTSALPLAPVMQTCAPDASTLLSGTMSCAPTQHNFAHYLKSPLVAPLRPRDKFILATRDIFDPFNLLTILANATYSVESDSHGVYGPGVNGIAKDSGVNFTENVTGEYFGTFIVCSLAHQDPHYHREPFLPIRHRILHAIAQIAWTKSDTGRPMFNYANFVGGIATAVVSNTFVPGPGQQGWGNTSKNLALAFATSPSGNLVTEFLPDIASHINFHVVIFQRILNSVANENGGTVQ